MWSDKERLSMWNRVGVKYDTVLIAPAPNIRCPFFVHHIHPPYLLPLLRLLIVYDYSSPVLLVIYQYRWSTPTSYPLQQLLVPVHRPYSFTLPPTPSSCLLQLPSSFYQFPFFDNYDCSFDNYSSSPSISPPRHPIVKHRRQWNTEDRKRSHRE